MTEKGTKKLETERLILRAFRISDAKATYENWANDPQVTKFLTWPPHRDVQATERILSEWVEKYESPDYYQWAIVLKSMGDKPVGCISVINEIDKRILSAEIGYCLGKEYWHKGIMSEALSAVIDYLFDEVGLLRVSARHAPENPNSGLVMQKCGMKYEGTLRQSDYNNQGVCDACCYSILASER